MPAWETIPWWLETSANRSTRVWCSAAATGFRQFDIVGQFPRPSQPDPCSLPDSDPRFRSWLWRDQWWTKPTPLRSRERRKILRRCLGYRRMAAPACPADRRWLWLTWGWRSSSRTVKDLRRRWPPSRLCSASTQRRDPCFQQQARAEKQFRLLGTVALPKHFFLI